MSIIIRLKTLKDRVKMRLLEAEAEDLRAEMRQAVQYSDGWVALRSSLGAIYCQMCMLSDKIRQDGWRGSSACSWWEVSAVVSVALVALLASVVILFSFDPGLHS